MLERLRRGCRRLRVSRVNAVTTHASAGCRCPAAACAGRIINRRKPRFRGRARRQVGRARGGHHWRGGERDRPPWRYRSSHSCRAARRGASACTRPVGPSNGGSSTGPRASAASATCSTTSSARRRASRPCGARRPGDAPRVPALIAAELPILFVEAALAAPRRSRSSARSACRGGRRSSASSRWARWGFCSGASRRRRRAGSRRACPCCARSARPARGPGPDRRLRPDSPQLAAAPRRRCGRLALRRSPC